MRRSSVQAGDKMMNGLSLSRLYYSEVFLPECRKRFPAAERHFAAGLVGEGSECFGYDDELSQDHSFGLRLCIWLTPEDFIRYGTDLNELWNSIPETFMGYQRPASTLNEGKRSGIFSVAEFYQQILGAPGAPTDLRQWLAIPEPCFAAATNGEVFSDEPGIFTSVRKTLLSHFPSDITRFYLARHAAIAAQTGQYNLLRVYRHGEELAADNIRARFIQSAMAMVFLLNKTYRPFYKWAPRAMRSLPILGDEIHNKLLRLSGAQEIREQISLIEDICACILTEMRLQGYTSGQSNYLMDHIPEIMRRIEAQEIRSRGISLVF